ncbi:phage head completion protein [Ligilactobacillus salivarius]|uniref:phage head completion protein n=1 Tax=Ligilactobacillus salivarius TaxID=1624 RepID=UPI0009DB4871|nr:head-tail adaptor protein [Ligilactobacillus salivarius]OQR15232.1 head-tail adaptor protein [Ligilactobacillus salivarius]
MIAETGDLTEIIKIVRPQAPTIDEYGDEVSSSDEVIYPMLYAMLRSKNANDVEKNLSTLSTSAQFVIRHRFSGEPIITTDMELIHNNERYKITNFNVDTQYKNFDVIICKKTPE